VNIYCLIKEAGYLKKSTRKNNRFFIIQINRKYLGDGVKQTED